MALVPLLDMIQKSISLRAFYFCFSAINLVEIGHIIGMAGGY